MPAPAYERLRPREHIMSLNKDNSLKTLIVVPPLPTLEDKGFTANVLARSRRLKWQRYALNVIVWVSAGLTFLTVIPWRNFASEIDNLTTTLLNPLYQLQDVELLSEWMNAGLSQSGADSPTVLLTALILTLLAGTVAGLVFEE